MQMATHSPHFSTPFASSTNADMLPDFLNIITDNISVWHGDAGFAVASPMLKHWPLLGQKF